MPESDLSVSETAALVGVSSARVYQRLADPLQPLDGVARVIPGGRRRPVSRVLLCAALAWRAARMKAGAPVGSSALVDRARVRLQHLPPPRPTPAPLLPAPAVRTANVGLPRFTPF